MKRIRMVAVVLLAVTAIGWQARGEETAKTVAADLSSPLAALRTGKAALVAGDAATMKRCYHTDNPHERKALEAMVDGLAAQVRFQQVCAKQFGEDSAQRVAPAFNTEIPADAREQIDGDRATLHNIGGSRPTTLRRVNGEWKFTYASVVENNFRDLPPMPPPRLAKIFDASRQMYDALSEEVAAGKFEFIEDAMNALSQRRKELQKTIDKVIAERE